MTKHRLSTRTIQERKKQKKYYKKANTNLKKKNNKDAIGKAAKGFDKDEASEAPPMGPLAGDNAGRDPIVDGTKDDLGVNGPSDSGAGDGANIESLITVEGGAMRGGNFCGPVLRFETKCRNKLDSQ